MINDLATPKGLQNISQQLVTSEVSGSAHSKEMMLAISKIQIGDVLQGKLILENEQAMLKLESGLKLLANLPDNLVFNKQLDFLVMGKERQRLLLEIVQNLESEGPTTSLTEQAIQELAIKDTPEMRQIVEQFVSKQLPLVKEQLLQLLHFSKSYDIPTEALVNLVSQKQVPQQSELHLLTGLKEDGVKVLLPMLDDLIDTLSPQQSREMVHSIAQLLKPDEIRGVLLMENAIQHETGISQVSDEKGVSIHLAQGEAIPTEKLEVLQEYLKQSIGAEIKSPQWQSMLNKLLEDVLQFTTHDQLKKLSKAFIHESLTVHLESIENQEKDEVEKMTDTAARLKQITKVIEEIATEGKEKANFQMLEGAIEVLDKYNTQGHYFCFPLQLKEQNTTGELYFFKPKKKKGQQGQGMYIVLALNMPTLNKIEVHLIEQSEKINLKIKVENEAIKKQLEQYENVLLEEMKSAEMPMEKIVIELLTEKKASLLKEESSVLCHLDFKV